MTTAAVRLAVASTLIVSAACSSSSAPSTTTPQSATLTGSVTDPVGDTVITPVFRNGVLVTPVVLLPLPDLVAGTVTVDGGSLTVTVSFAQGTLSHADTFFCVLFDTDENPATGNLGSAGDEGTFGWDYSICAPDRRGSMAAVVSRALGPSQPGQVAAVGSASLVFPSADQGRVTVPLSLLGNDDGRMAFKVHAMQWVDDPVVFNTGIIDFMPDVGRPSGLVR